MGGANRTNPKSANLYYSSTAVTMLASLASLCANPLHITERTYNTLQYFPSVYGNFSRESMSSPKSFAHRHAEDARLFVDPEEVLESEGVG